MNVFDILREKLEAFASAACKKDFDLGLCRNYENCIDCITSKIRDEVDKIEKEYNNGFCEWKFEQTTGIVWHCDDKCTTYNLPYSTNLRIIADDFECKCPYCGKKIKVVE